MAMFFVLAVSMSDRQAMAVDVYGEGAYSDISGDVQVCIYADITESEALRSFGVRLIFNNSELTFDGTRSSKNKAVWYLKDNDGNTHEYPHGDPVDVGGAVVIIGGVLDPNANPDKVSGDRVLLGTVWFTRASSSGPLTNPLTLALGKDAPYANFVVGPDPADVLDGSGVYFIDYGDGAAIVKVRERGDAEGDVDIDVFDILETRKIIDNAGYSVWADCEGDEDVDVFDILCIRNMI